MGFAQVCDSCRFLFSKLCPLADSSLYFDLSLTVFIEILTSFHVTAVDGREYI